MKRIHYKSLVFPVIISIFMAFIMVFSFGCTKKEDTEIKIGAILPLTGDGAVYGIKEKEGIDLAVSEVNSTGGIQGQQVRVIYEDSKGESTSAVSALQKLITQDKVQVVFGDAFSSPTLAMIPIIDKNRVILMSPSASSPKLSNSSQYFFRVWPSDIAEGAVAAEIAMQKLQLKKLAVLHGNNEYGIGLKEVFASTISKLGGSVVIVETYNEGDSDFRAQLTKIKKNSPDGIYLAGYAKEFAKILIQAKELDVKVQFMSCGTFHEPEILKIAGNAAEGVVFVQPFFDENSNDPVVQKFVKNYEVKFKSKAGVYAAHAYDAASIIFSTIKEKGMIIDDIRNALLNLINYQGATGSTSIMPGGDVIKQSRVMTVKNGNFTDFK